MWKVSMILNDVSWSVNNRYGISCGAKQVTQWDFKNKGRLGRTGTSSFVLCVVFCTCAFSFSFRP